MFKRWLVIVVLVAGGLVGYEFFTTGEFHLMPSFLLSQEERTLRDLEQRMRRATREIAQAGRSAALSGVDTTSAASAAVEQLGRLEKELKELKKQVEPGSTSARIDELLAEIAALKGRG